ncbi:NAD(P)-dependent oxidoreductase [Alkalicoccobacillus gibsonii]|uniref:NAD(P)-dependent oxidoreductase n=1 Tax=Alkalicoccobacillus gibsonii TaxID=79881 RepID=UPI0035125126
MKIVILGATGRVGNELVQLALEDQHQVTALVRTPEKLTSLDEHLRVVQGDVLNKQDLHTAILDVDVVISALNTDGTTTLSESMPLILQVMEEKGIKRIITIGTAGILQSRTHPELLRYQSPDSKRKTTRAAEEHHKAYQTLEQSNLDWTIVCPTYLPEGERIGKYRVEKDFLPNQGVKISVKDTAQFAYDQLMDSAYVRARVGIAY